MSGSNLGHDLPSFDTLDAQIANSLKKPMTAEDFRKNEFLAEQQAQNEKQISSRKTNRLHELRLLQDHRYRRIHFLDFSDLVGVAHR